MHLSKNKKISFILNTLGIDMLSVPEKLDNSVQTYVHCSLRDRILTLHSHSLDEYSERELELLSKIEASVSKENKKNKILELIWNDFLNNHELLNTDIILNFTNFKIDRKNELTPPNLASLIKKPEKRNYYGKQMQALLNDN
jgi:hypothetical protein